MGVLLQAFYQRGNIGVPSQADGDHIDAWWDHLAKQANQLQKAGFTAIWLPPLTKGGSGKDSVGYDVFDDYDLGSKNQKGTVPTHYGTREQLGRCVAMFRANGIDVYSDLVTNQRGGGSGAGGFTFRYADADGQVGGGRFPKNPENFHPNVPEDPNVPGPDFSFGSDLAPINGKPKGYIFHGLIDGADWMTRSLDVQGYRIDDAKGQSSDFLLPFLNSKAMAGKFAVAEYFDGNIGKIQDWVSIGCAAARPPSTSRLALHWPGCAIPGRLTWPSWTMWASQEVILCRQSHSSRTMTRTEVSRSSRTK
jgi:alpha-amylase